MAMAGVAPLTKEELASKPIQEIAKLGDDIPDGFFRKEAIPEAIDAPELWTDHLLIDFSLLSSSSSLELDKLRSALSQWGCFQIINHGIEIPFLEELIQLSKKFFALPLEEKLEYSAADDIVQGYGTDSAYSGSETLNWNDRLLLFLQPKERIRLECWPQKPEKLSEMIEKYASKINTMNKALCKAMSRSLGLEENCLQIGKHGPAIALLNLYPRCSCPERVLGTRPHRDRVAITYLLPELEGLEIMNNDGQWYKVPVIPGAIFINFAELGEALTNGVFKSAMHRVRANSEKDRLSVVMFFNPDDDEVEPLSELVSADQPQLYRKFSMKEYRPKIYESYSEGSRPLDAFRV